MCLYHMRIFRIFWTMKICVFQHGSRHTIEFTGPMGCPMKDDEVPLFHPKLFKRFLLGEESLERDVVTAAAAAAAATLCIKASFTVKDNGREDELEIVSEVFCEGFCS